MLAMPEKKPFSAYALAFFVISTLLFGLLSALIGGSGGYEQLVAPPLAPPRILFPIVWTILYIAMGVAAYFVWQTDDSDRIPAIRLYYVQLAVNALWSLFFFRLDWRLFAFFWILLLPLLPVGHRRHQRPDEHHHPGCIQRRADLRMLCGRGDHRQPERR